MAADPATDAARAPPPELADLLRDWPQLSPLLDEALELAAAQRAAWLQQRTDLPADLRVQLQRLLGPPDAQAPPAWPPDRQALWTAGPEAGAPAPGAEVGPYRLLRVLGEGGMGAVWLAERSDGSLRRKVALKLPHATWTPGLAERLARERDILAELQHPHIARLLDAGIDAFGRPYLALEVVDGEPIDAWCAQRAAPLRQQLEMLVQVADAVAHAHSRGVLHRDLKPANILVTTDAQVRLLDFGIAKLMQDGRTEDTALTLAAGAALTPDYASPEQIRGEALAAASDVYSLGVVAYELLTGHRPHRLPTDRAALGAALLTLDPVPPSRRAGDTGRQRALRGDLDAILLKALQPQAAQRYATADAFAQDLQRHLRGERVLARHTTPWQRALGRLRQRRRPLLAGAAIAAALALAIDVGATALVMAILAAATALALWQATRIRQQAAEAQRQATRAQAVQRFLEGIFEPMGVDQGDAATRQRLTAADLLGRAADQLAQGRIGGDAALAADLQGVVGRLLHDLALSERAVDLRRQRLLSLQRQGAPVLQRAQALAELADSLRQQGQFDEAEQRLQAALALLAGQAGSDAAVRHALLGAQLANLRLAVRADAAAMALLADAIARLRTLAPGSLELADALAIQATALSEHQHESDSAYAVAQEAIGLLEQRRDQRLRAAQLRHRIAALLFAQRRYDEADREMRQALQTWRQVAGDEHPATAVVAVALARQLTIHSRLEESLALLREFVPVLEAAGTRVDPMHRAEARMALGEALLEEGRVAEAVPALEDAVAQLRQAAGPIPLTVGALLLARALAESGRYDESLTLLHETLQTRIGLWGEAHPSTALVMQRIGSVLLWAGRLDEAEHWLQRVAGTADVREHAFGSVKHRAAATLVQVTIERGQLDAALGPASALRDAMLALPAEQRTRALRLGTELTWLRVLLGLGRLDEPEAPLAALMALSAPLYEAAPLRLAVWAQRTRWLAARGRSDEARAQLAETEAGYALQPLAPHFTRLLDEARSAVRAGGG